MHNLTILFAYNKVEYSVVQGHELQVCTVNFTLWIIVVVLLQRRLFLNVNIQHMSYAAQFMQLSLCSK